MPRRDKKRRKKTKKGGRRRGQIGPRAAGLLAPPSARVTDRFAAVSDTLSAFFANLYYNDIFLVAESRLTAAGAGAGDSPDYFRRLTDYYYNAIEAFGISVRDVPRDELPGPDAPVVAMVDRMTSDWTMFQGVELAAADSRAAIARAFIPEREWASANVKDIDAVLIRIVQEATQGLGRVCVEAANEEMRAAGGDPRPREFPGVYLVSQRNPATFETTTQFLKERAAGILLGLRDDIRTRLVSDTGGRGSGAAEEKLRTVVAYAANLKSDVVRLSAELEDAGARVARLEEGLRALAAERDRQARRADEAERLVGEYSARLASTLRQPQPQPQAWGQQQQQYAPPPQAYSGPALSYSSPTESYSQPAQSQLYTPAAAAYSTEPTYEDEEEEEGGDSDEDDSDSDEAGIGVDSGDFDESADSAFESAGGLLTGSLTE